MSTVRGGGKLQFHTAMAYPPVQFGRITVNQRIVRDIASDNGTRADEAVGTQCGSAHNRCVGTDASALSDKRRFVFVLTWYMRSWIYDIREDSRWSAKYVVFENDTGVYGNIILNFDVIADLTAWRYHNVLADIASFSNSAISHDVAEVPYLCVFPDCARLIYATGFMCVVIAWDLHYIPPKRSWSSVWLS